jgi:hypothetical protein
MRLQDERIPSPQTAIEHGAGQSSSPNSGPQPAITSHPSLQTPYRLGSMTSSAVEALLNPPDEGLPGGFQEAHITAILRAMSLGHLVLGVLLALGGVGIEIVSRESAFFGLAASGGMLSICGLITLLAVSRQQAGQSPLAFYLLPYADFAIVGLWLLLFSAAGPVILFYAYVVVSAAMLLGSRHALALAGIAGAAILAISLGQYANQVTPAIILSPGEQTAFTIVATTLGLGLIAYVARLFSLNLDRFIALTNRQKEQVVLARRRVVEQQEQTQEALENLSNTYVRFIAGDTEARADVSNSSLSLAGHILNTLLEQIERLWRASAAYSRMEERVGELTLAVDRLSSGDPSAFQALNGPSGTSLDTLTLALARIGRQLLLAQQALQHAVGGYTAVTGIAADLSLLRQALSGADSVLHDLQTRSAQNAVRLHVLLTSEGSIGGKHTPERPILQEMEMRAQQQGDRLGLFRAQLGHIGAQMQAIETELRRIAESMEQLTRLSRPPRADQPGTPAAAPAPNTSVRPASGPLKTAEGLAPATAAPARRPSGILRPADALPRRFTGPLMSPERSPAEQPNLS